MDYKPKGMHAAATGSASAVKHRLPTVRTILPRGRKQSVRLLDSWDMSGPVKAVVMPGAADAPLVRISRKLRVSPLTRIAERMKRGWHG